jgi:hypothetical protein
MHLFCMGISNPTKFYSVQSIKQFKLTTFFRAYDLKKQIIIITLAKISILKPLQYFTKQLTLSKKKKKRNLWNYQVPKILHVPKGKEKSPWRLWWLICEKNERSNSKLPKLVVQASP